VSSWDGSQWPVRTSTSQKALQSFAAMTAEWGQRLWKIFGKYSRGCCSFQSLGGPGMVLMPLEEFLAVAT
jgi:hypothetical protein